MELSGQSALSETVLSVIKHTLSDTVRARSWYREFRKNCSDVYCRQHQASYERDTSSAVWRFATAYIFLRCIVAESHAESLSI